jgi:hypothetical protein
MNGYSNQETYYFALWYLDAIQEMHLENNFSSWVELEMYCYDFLEEINSGIEGWAKDVISSELEKVDFRDLFEKLTNE